MGSPSISPIVVYLDNDVPETLLFFNFPFTSGLKAIFDIELKSVILFHNKNRHVTKVGKYFIRKII